MSDFKLIDLDAARLQRRPNKHIDRVLRTPPIESPSWVDDRRLPKPPVRVETEDFKPPREPLIDRVLNVNWGFLAFVIIAALLVICLGVAAIAALAWLVIWLASAVMAFVFSVVHWWPMR